MKGFHVSASGAIQGHHGPLVFFGGVGAGGGGVVTETNKTKPVESSVQILCASLNSHNQKKKKT